jgi:acyl-CoA synthetase (NDP forming)
METLKSWLTYHERRDALLARNVLKLVDDAAVGRAHALLASRRPGETLTESASKALLASYGIPVTKEQLVHGEDEAVLAAAGIGYPVVLKAESADIPHKTEAGVVHLALADEPAVRRAYRAIMEKVAELPGAPVLAGISVQEMARGGIEMMVGVTKDPQFGPLIVCGLGGIAVEVLRDTASALAPVSKDEALEMLRSLRSYKLLSGYRGTEPVALDALAEMIARISQLGADQRDLIDELDVNPILAGPHQMVALDALAIIAADADRH